MAIKDWPRAERPREKLIRHGRDTLSNAELLAILWGKGYRDCDAVDLARGLLVKYGGINPLIGLDRLSFTKTPGLGDAKYAILQAAMSLAERALGEQLTSSAPISDAADAKCFFRAALMHRDVEVFSALFLDTRHQVREFEILATGTIDHASVHPREVIKRVIELRAAAVIFAHNHPSGIATISESDRRLTAQLQAALRLIDVEVLDHLIVAAQGVVSMAELGELP